MAQTLLGILFATSSAKDQTIAFRWPPSIHSSPRLARPRPSSQLNLTHVDAPYRAATFLTATPKDQEIFTTISDTIEFEWQRPSLRRLRSHSFASSRRSSSGGRRSPAAQLSEHASLIHSPEYDVVLGYNVDLLAHFLCPMKNNCHQKFELIVDDLVFIGHPVCVNESGKWDVKTEGDVYIEHSRSNGDDFSSELEAEAGDHDESSLRLFHVVFVLDLPDPSSSASGNINKYFDTIYRTVVFPLTAVLFNEQILHNYVEQQWDILVKIKEDFISNGDGYDRYTEQCLQQSSLAQGLQRIHTSIRSNSLARLTFNDITFDLQLPPFLDELLRTDQSTLNTFSVETEALYNEEDEQSDRPYVTWGPELSFGWKLPAFAPWKALLLLDVELTAHTRQGDPLSNFDGAYFNSQEHEVAEGISRFLDCASVFVSLNDMATLLNWNLEEKIYPTVRYLVQRRRAKLVDTVRSSLKSIFALTAQLNNSSVAQTLTSQFAEAFPTLPALPVILSRLSSSQNNFYETVVRSKDLIPIYRNVVVWCLKRDLLVMLHMRFRLVASPTLKRVVAERRRTRLDSRERRRIMSDGLLSRGRRRLSSTENDMILAQRRNTILEQNDEEAVEDESGDDLPASLARLTPSLQSSPVRNREMMSRSSFLSTPLEKARYGKLNPAISLLSGEHRHRRYSDMSPASRVRPSNFSPDSGEDDYLGNIESESESDPEDTEDLGVASIITDPERATPKERRWLRGMTFGKNNVVAKQFENLYKYFDGKATVDEILYRAEISRKDLREVLQEFSEHILTFLHA